MKLLSPLILILLTAVSPLVAQQTAGAPDSPVEPANALRLSMDGAIEAATQNNLGVSIQRVDFQMAEQTRRGAWAPFDWLTSATIETSSQERPVTSVIFSPVSETTVANVGVQQTLPTGANYTVGFNNQKQASNNPFITFNPAFTTGLNLGFTQPLLRNFGVDVNTRGIRIARNNLGISEESFRSVMLDTVLGVQQAYYDLIAARRNLEVRRQSLDLVRDQERITQIRIDVGAAAPLDILQPRVDIALREEEVIIGEAAIRAAEDRLRQLMNLPGSEWDRPIVPTDTVAFAPMEVDVEAAVARAYQLRPEVEQAELTIDTREIQHLYARNQRLPQLDFRVDYGYAGVGGTEIVRDPVTGDQIGTVAGGYGDALDQVYGFDFPSWTVGFNVGMPVRNIGARAEARRAELEVLRSREDVARVKQNVAVRVRQTARDIETASRQIVASRAARDAAEQNLEAEQKRFENGMTTNFQVLQAQRDLADARSREIAALVGYNKSIASYHHAVGDLLEHHDIELDLPETGKTGVRWERVRWLNFGNYAD
ncbi:MAG TPA: TolC family protein [Thermoanaerobaculia bacterium]|nr:TolC family protein [Thermoanaerobaculia bacterium]